MKGVSLEDGSFICCSLWIFSCFVVIDKQPEGKSHLTCRSHFYRKSIESILLFLGAIRKQLAAFLEGFYEIIPKRLISIFTEQELELLISGLPTIDIDDLKANTEYHKYQSSSIQVGMS